MRGISKRFPGVDALRDVSVMVRRGEVLGLVGENGAGKSTLMKVLSGAYRRTAARSGSKGSDRAPTPPRMIELGVAVIYQEMMIAPHLTVAENLFLGRLPRGRLGLVDWAAAASGARRSWRGSGSASIRAPGSTTLSVAQRQMVEIARALSRTPVVILDEPSAVLGDPSLPAPSTWSGACRAGGLPAFVYISHRLREVFAICDRVTVLLRRHGGRHPHIADADSDVTDPHDGRPALRRRLS